MFWAMCFLFGPVAIPSLKMGEYWSGTQGISKWEKVVHLF